MNLLVPIPFDLTSLAHGRNLRIVHLLRQLTEHADVTCVAPDEPSAEIVRHHGFGADVVAARPTLDPMQPTGEKSSLLHRVAGFFGDDPHLLAEITRRAVRADVVLGFDLASVRCLLAAEEAQPRPRIICDLIDDPWLTWKSSSMADRYGLAGLETALALRLLRRYVLPRFDGLIAVAPRDADSLSRAAGRTVTVVPNGVRITADDTIPRDTEPLVVFTGAMDFPPNVAAAKYLVRRVWPKVYLASNARRQPPSATLAIVGANPTPAVQQLTETDGVVVTGRVDDLRAWLRRARVAVAPMVSG